MVSCIVDEKKNIWEDIDSKGSDIKDTLIKRKREMKKMKKIMTLLLAVLLVFSLAACGSAEKEVDMSLTDEMEAVLKDVPDLPMVSSVELDADNFKSFVFIDPVDGVTGVASEAMINAVAHSVVLLRAGSNADATKIAENIKTNINPRKWICVEAEKTAVVVHANTILMVMSATATVDAIVANFDNLYK